MSAPSARQVADCARRLLGEGPAPAACVRLRVDALGESPSSPGVRGARRQLADSAGVRELIAGQRRDGGFGRFHSRDTRAAAAIPTTEHAVRRALALGLSPRTRLLVRAADHCEALLAGRCAFPDPAERNDRWETGWRLFVAATLARIRPGSPALRPGLRRWRRVLREAFATGGHREADEVAALLASTGAHVRGSYLRLDSRYAVELLATRAGELPEATRDGYLRWLVASRAGLGYLGVPLHRPPRARAAEVDRWLASWELVARYPGWARHGASMARWLWAQRGREGRWDFGPRAGSPALPLSDDWRGEGSRAMDWSARCLALLGRHARAR